MLRHIDMPADRITVVDGDDHTVDIAKYREMGVKYQVKPIVPGNMAEVLKAHLEAGDMLINLSVDVSSVALMNWCQANGCTYHDTCIQPWAHYYANSPHAVHDRTHYVPRHQEQENAPQQTANGTPPRVTPT